MGDLFRQPAYVAIEGPIRAGKTTFAQELARTLGAIYLAEPENNPFLEGFYEGKPAAFPAQMWFLEERHRQLRPLADAEMATSIVADYIFEKDKIFACLNLTDVELELYNRYYQSMHAGLRVPDLTIYLKATPEVLKQRLKRKNLPQEREISEEYIEQVAASYEHFFSHYTAGSLLVVDTSHIDFVSNPADLQALLARLQQPVRGTEYYLPLPAPVEVPA